MMIVPTCNALVAIAIDVQLHVYVHVYDVCCYVIGARSLHSNSQLDMNIKGTMVKDLLNLAGFMIPEKSDVRDTSSHHDM